MGSILQIGFLERVLKQRPDFSVSMVLEGIDKLIQFYTGMPTYESFIAFSNYLKPKALHLQAWRGSETLDARSTESSLQKILFAASQAYQYATNCCCSNQVKVRVRIF